MLTQPVHLFQRFAGSAVRSAMVGDDHLTADELASSEDPGLFGPHSVGWKVHADPCMFIGGLRALLLQSLHPPTMAGVADHSEYSADPWGRLHRTGRFIGATTYGNTETATQVIDTVRTIHERITGTTPQGVPYRANDPHLLQWVHITEVDSFLGAYQQYGQGRLTKRECDRYVAEMSEIGHRLGAVDLPTDTSSLQNRINEYRSECAYNRQARQAVRFLLVPPLAIALRGPYGVVAAASIGLLPRWAQHKMWIWLPPGVDSLAVRPAATVLTRAFGWLMEGTDNTPVADLLDAS